MDFGKVMVGHSNLTHHPSSLCPGMVLLDVSIIIDSNDGGSIYSGQENVYKMFQVVNNLVRVDLRM